MREKIFFYFLIGQTLEKGLSFGRREICERNGILMEIQIVSGFLGAGKTTFLNHYLPLLCGKTVLIENEFGDVDIDKNLIKRDVPIEEIYSGCICCTLAGDFVETIQRIYETYAPDYLLIEPSGAGRLSDVVKACERAGAGRADISLTKLIVLIDGQEFDEYGDEFGLFYLDQIRESGMLFLSNMDGVGKDRKEGIIQKLRAENAKAVIYEDDWRSLTGEELLALIDKVPDYAYKGKTAFLKKPLPKSGETFSAISFPLLKPFGEEELKELLCTAQEGKFGGILRGKGFAEVDGRGIIHFDLTPAKLNIEDITQKEKEDLYAVFIGCDIDENKIKASFVKKEEK